MTHTNSLERRTRAAKAEDGMALLIAVIVLLLMSALGLAALQHASDEASGSGRSRRKDATLYAADSGLKLLQVRLLTNFVASPNMTPVSLDEPTLIKDGYGNSIAIRSGSPENGGLPAAPAAVGPSAGPSQHAEGYMINTGGQGTQSFKPARADVTALDVANGMVHLQAQFTVLDVSGGGGY